MTEDIITHRQRMDKIAQAHSSKTLYEMIKSAPQRVTATKEDGGDKWDGDKPPVDAVPSRLIIELAEAIAKEPDLRLDLVPASAIISLARRLSVGAKKYGDRNWERGISWRRILASAGRHWLAFKDGEDIDPDDGGLHLDALITNVAFLIEYSKTRTEYDDRKS